MSKTLETEEERLARAIHRLNGRLTGLVYGLALAIGIFVATNWLVIKGGNVVGPHLNLLGQFFVGYRVSFVGSLIGAAYGFVLGFAAAWLIALLYNWILDLRIGTRRPS